MTSGTAPPQQPAAVVQPDRPDVFISYSREDGDWVRDSLHPALVARGKDVWIDLEDIRLGAPDWRAMVWAGIESTKAVVFVMTPASLSSPVCREELERAVELNKRIIPLLRHALEGADVPPALARPNWIPVREEDDEPAAFAALFDALETDEEWLTSHARLAVRTGEWLRAGRDASFLLRGSDLRAAQSWLDEQGSHRESATAEQAEYIGASRRTAARRQRVTLAGVALALAVSILLGVVALLQREEAIDQRAQAIERAQIARSGELAARALAATDSDPEEALGLALAAAAVRATPAAEQALRKAVLGARWQTILRSDARALDDAAFSPDGRLVVTAGAGGAAALFDVRSSRRVALLRHRDAVHSAEFSPDGRTILTASGDGTARTWSTAGGRRLRVLRPRAGSVESAAFGARGRLVVTATAEGGAHVWDASSGRRIADLSGRGDQLGTTRLSSDGRLALTGAGSDAKLWSVARERVETVLKGTGATLRAAVFADDGRTIATAYDDRRVRVWATRGGRPVAELRGHPREITGVEFSPGGGQLVTTSTDGTARVWATASGRELAVLRHSSAVNGARFSPDERHIVTASDDGSARIWNAARARTERVLRGHTDRVTVARFSADGERVVTGSDDGTARIWTTREPGVTRLAGRWPPVAGATFSPDSRLVLAAHDDGAAVWDAATGRRLAMLAGGVASGEPFDAPCGRMVGCAPWSADSRLVAGASEDGIATIWDARTGAVERRLGGSTGAAFSPDARRLVAHGERAAHVWDLAAGRRESSAPRPRSGEALMSARFAPDGDRILTVAYDFRAALSEASGTKPSVAIAGRADAAAMSPGGKLAIGTPGGELRLFDAVSGRLERSIAAHAGPIRAVAYAPDGARVATAGEDRTARIWDVAAGRQVALLRGHQRQLSSAAYDPAGKLVLTAGDDGTARLWDPGLEGSILVLRKSELGSAEFSPDGRRIVLVGDAGVELHDCDVCTSLHLLVRKARALSASSGRPP